MNVDFYLLLEHGEIYCRHTETSELGETARADKDKLVARN